MIELETMLMQFCLETSGRLNGDRYPVGERWNLHSPLACPPAQFPVEEPASGDPLKGRDLGV